MRLSHVLRQPYFNFANKYNDEFMIIALLTMIRL